MSVKRGGGCPNGEALSAFLDRETESTRGEAIALHLQGCPRCREELDRLQRLRKLLEGDQMPEPRMSFLSIRELMGEPGPGASPRLPVWRRRVTLPLPAAAAAAVLIVVLALALGISSTRSGMRRMSIRRGPAGMTEVEVAAPVGDLERLLRSLDQQSPGQQVIITLPPHSNLILMGAPRLLREADFERVGK
jgi:anti-sigma factor RsiW